MSSASPSPNSPPATAPPPSTTTPPPRPSFPPPNLSNSPPPDPPSAPPPQPNSPPPDPPSAPPPQPNSPPPDPPSGPPPQPNSPPPTASLPPTDSPPVTVTPPPMDSPPPSSPPPNPPAISPPPPPPPANLPSAPPPDPPSPPPPDPPSSPPLDPPGSPPPNPPSSPPPDPPSSPPPDPPSSPPPDPPSSPPPPAAEPPRISPPPPTTRPPESSPPPPQPPTSSPPSPPPPQPPNSSPPPPPPSPRPSQSSPPPPSARPPRNSPPPPPSARPPRNSPPPPPSPSPPPFAPPTNSSNSPPRASPPLPAIVSPPSRSPPLPTTPPSDTTNNDTPGDLPPSPQSTSGGGIGTGGTVAIVVALSFLLLGIFGVAAFCVWKRKKKASRHNGGHIMPTSVPSPGSDSGLLKVAIAAPNYGSGFGNGNGSGSGNTYSPDEPGGLGNSRSWFNYEDLVDATNGFSSQNLLGEGGFGCVYKGTLVDGRVVAVKQLKIGGNQGEREFRSEVEIISRIHHRHLVSLVGYCISEERRLLVYDYVPNNTLYFHLHGEGRPVMDWAARVKIAIGAARGIAYLHEDCHPRIIHRDIKSSNILLDNNFEARVSDFGLAKIAMDANTHITTRVMGTFGYMAPEYASSGKLTEKSDVFSFGVVLLELITGRKPVDTSQPLGDESLVEWARPLLSHAIEIEQFEGLADPKLNGNYVDSEMFRMIEAAAACVRHSSAKRPKMGQVVRAFDSMAAADLTNGMKVGESEIFNSAQQSAEIRLFRRMAFGSQDFSTDYFTQSSGSSESNQVNSRRENPNSNMSL